MQKCTFVLAMVFALLLALKPQETQARMTFPQLKNALKGMAKTCAAKSGVDPEIAKKSASGEFPKDEALGCYFLCIYTGMKVVRDGRISLDIINKQVDMMVPLDKIARSKEVSQLCDQQSTSEDNCERSWEFTKCYWDTDSSIYFFP